MLEPQFLRGSLGSLFAIYHFPHPAVPRRGGILYIPPFAEELNKSRRMIALQARHFAAAGFGVLIPDLYGCGDSEGDFAEARWEVWLEDLRLCLNWLQARNDGPVSLWGLRLGALLASELIQDMGNDIARLVLWQPVINGEQMLTQFLRLRLAAGMMTGNKETTTQLREVLAAGHSLEVAGYELAPDLAAALNKARLKKPSTSIGTSIDWFELVAILDRPLAPASRRVIEDWQATGVSVDVHAVPGEPFWATQEITLAPALLKATTAALSRSLSA